MVEDVTVKVDGGPGWFTVRGVEVIAAVADFGEGVGGVKTEGAVVEAGDDASVAGRPLAGSRSLEGQAGMQAFAILRIPDLQSVVRRRRHDTLVVRRPCAACHTLLSGR